MRLNCLQLCLKPISKSPEEDNQARELDEAKEILGVILPSDEDAALPLNPCEKTFYHIALRIAAAGVDLA
jgi:hypothetical protein